MRPSFSPVMQRVVGLSPKIARSLASDSRSLARAAEPRRRAAMANQVWDRRGPRVNPSRTGRLAAVISLEFPRGEAPQVKVEFVQALLIAVIRELNLELQLVAAHGPLADGAGGADRRGSQRTIGSLGGHLAGLDRCTSLLAENSFLWHLVDPDTARHDRRRRGPYSSWGASDQMPADRTPV